MLVHHLSSTTETTWLAVGGYGPGSGRFGANVAALIALIGVAVAVLARTRFRHTAGERGAALLAQAIGLTGMILAVWHVARSAAGFGTGNGRAGALVAAAIALTALILAAWTLARPHAPDRADLER
ncbi:DUF6223 family protein [Nocardia tengchongensis]